MSCDPWSGETRTILTGSIKAEQCNARYQCDDQTSPHLVAAESAEGMAEARLPSRRSKTTDGTLRITSISHLPRAIGRRWWRWSSTVLVPFVTILFTRLLKYNAPSAVTVSTSLYQDHAQSSGTL
jgi:hypothetical protein